MTPAQRRYSVQHAVYTAWAGRFASGPSQAIVASHGGLTKQPWRTIRAAHKDYTSRGNMRAHWFRMRWDGVSWEYFAEERLPTRNFTAAERNATVRGSVPVGALVVQHDYKGPVTHMWVVPEEGDLTPVDYQAQGSRMMVTLPDGSTLNVSHPRK